MANLWIDSLQWAGNQDDLRKRYTHVTGSLAMSATGGRRGGRCSHADDLYIALPDIDSDVAIVGQAVKSPLAGWIFAITDGGYDYAANSSTLAQVGLRLLADGSLQVTRGCGLFTTTVLAQSAPGVLLPSTYYYFELKARIHATLGTVDVHVNGAPVLGLTGLTGLNTVCSGVAQWTGVVFCAGDAGYHHDFYINDGSGASDNDFWGDTRVDRHRPIADGPVNAWTPSAGSDHYALVDEETPNDGTDYLATNTLNAKELVKVEDLINAGGTIRSVMLAVLAAKTDAGACGVTPITRPDSVDQPGAEMFPSLGTYKYALQLMPKNPDTSAVWTEAEFNAARFGVQKTT